MALFEVRQSYRPESEEGLPPPPTFKECAAVDIDLAFFVLSEHAEERTVDGKRMPVVLDEQRLREHSSHWEAGAKQNFDTGLYTALTVLYLRAADYGEKPKVGKLLVLDRGTKRQRTYSIVACAEEAGVYRMTLERTRQ